MELRHLRYFVAVAEELHFRRAAERLHIAQPAVSEQVRKLEQELGVRLLERTPRSVRLTDAGAVMLEDARRVLQLADTAGQSARNARSRSAARLQIGYVATALPAAVPRALQAVRASVALTDATLERGATHELIQAVRGERLHAAVVPLPAPVNGLRVLQLRDQHAVAVLPISHPHSTQTSIRLDQVAPERLIVPPREGNRPFYDGIISACREARLAPSLVELPHDNLEQIVLAVAAGAGMALLPESVAERYAGPGVRFVPVADAHSAFALGVVTRRDNDHLPTAWFLRVLARSACVPPPTLPRRSLAVVAA